MFRVGSYEVPKEDWESTPASVRELMVKIVKENEELREKVNKLEARLGHLEECFWFQASLCWRVKLEKEVGSDSDVVKKA